MATLYSLVRDGQAWLSDHFQVYEFQSYCDDWGRTTTDDVLIDMKLVKLLEDIFVKLNCTSIIVTSGYRSSDFEMYLAGFCGYHNLGMAADIVCYDQQKRPITSTDVCCAAQDCGAHGIGMIGPYSVHVDVRDGHWWGVEDTAQNVDDWYAYAGKAKQPEQSAGSVQTVIDVSYSQGLIDWQAVKDSGITAAIIRCGYGDDDPSQDDEYWQRNVNECERLGIPHGVYLYTYADTWEHARSEIEHLKRLLAGRKLQMPVYIDIEEPELLPKFSTEIFQWMGEQIEAMGYWCGMYASASVFRDYLGSDLDHFTRWVAQYNDTFESYGDMWQYTDAGHVPGIGCNVDVNILYRDIIGQMESRKPVDVQPTPTTQTQHTSNNEAIKAKIIDLVKQIQ